MLTAARGKKEDYVIIDSVCPLPDQREILNCDITVWANDTTTKYPDIEFQEPRFYDVKCDNYTPEVLNEIIRKINSKNI
jgi:hypothetical protein